MMQFFLDASLIVPVIASVTLHSVYNSNIPVKLNQKLLISIRKIFSLLKMDL